MRNKLLLALLSLLVVANVYAQSPSHSALFYRSVRLFDGDSICLTSYYPDDDKCVKEKAIYNKYYDQVMSAGVMKIFDIQKHEDELKDRPRCGSFYCKHPLLWNTGMFSRDEYYHSLVRVKDVRDVVSGIVSDMLVDLCKYFPKDFKTEVLSELQEIKNTIQVCKKHRYECVDGELYVDGVVNNEVDYLEGFVARRICMDGIPISEMETFVSKLSDRLKSINTDGNADVMSEVTINNELSYCIGIEGMFLFSEKNKKKTILFDDVWHSRSTSIGQKVFYTNGPDGGFYKICNQYINKGEWGPLYKSYNDVRELILTAEGNEIYRNKTKPVD